jgi:3-hydroxyacyl-CoA dehydrogenase
MSKKYPASSIQHPASSIRAIGIIGEGRMGTGIFHYLLDFPYRLCWIVSPEADTGNLKNSLEKRLRRALKAGIIGQEAFDRKLAETVISGSVNELAACDLVIEAINENLKLKKQLFITLGQVTKPSCILATNSSSINPSRLWFDAARNPFIIGVHYFYPVSLKEFVEVTVSPETSGEVADAIQTFLDQTKKKVLILDESNSFILNRLFLDIQNEAFLIAEQGKATEKQIDRIVKERLFSFGIFDFMDNVGIDTMLAAVKNYTSGYPHRDYYSGLINRLETLDTEGKLGLKTGNGFYSYSGTSPVKEDLPSLPAHDADEILEYLKNSYLNSAKRFTMQSGLTIDEMNDSIKEYFGTDKGPFE